MRKTVIDGSNTAGFQRTMIIGRDGHVDTKHGQIGISGVYLEEEAAGIVGEKGDEKTYRLDRLGIPLVEIATGILQLTPLQVKEVALEIGKLLRMTGKVQRGIGSIRQDLNVSIPGGARVEIKGVQEIRILDKLIENEAARQEKLVKEGKKVQEETRKANEDGTTDYMRVLPGSDRMYPETDVPSLLIDREKVEKIKALLPEKPGEVLKRLKERYKISEQLADKLVLSENRELFMEICDSIKADPTTVAITLEETSASTGAKLSKKQYLELFKALADGKLAREALPIIMSSWKESESLSSVLKKAKLEAVSEKEVEREVKELVKKTKGMDKNRAFNVVMGEAMKKFRGKISGSVISDIVRRELA
jgi:Glu-tRNA(Gln) amidotransferase subunit E-like FAD-binding protein